MTIKPMTSVAITSPPSHVMSTVVGTSSVACSSARPSAAAPPAGPTIDGIAPMDGIRFGLCSTLPSEGNPGRCLQMMRLR
jgi:hypothetical protein